VLRWCALRRAGEPAAVPRRLCTYLSITRSSNARGPAGLVPGLVLPACLRARAKVTCRLRTVSDVMSELQLARVDLLKVCGCAAQRLRWGASCLGRGHALACVWRAYTATIAGSWKRLGGFRVHAPRGKPPASPSPRFALRTGVTSLQSRWQRPDALLAGSGEVGLRPAMSAVA
jgi:hypothetical protein